MYSFINYTVFSLSKIVVLAFTCYVYLIHYVDTYKQWFTIHTMDNPQNLQLFDYIIVGAGSAGAVLAARLAGDKQNTLLIEAGGKAPPFFDIPLLSPLFQQTPYDWQYVTVPQAEACKALINNQSRWPTGKIVGGSSRLNYMAYVRGHPLDYDGWFPDFIEPTKLRDSMSVSDLKWNTVLADTVLEAAKEIHQPVGNINHDLNSGFMKVQLSMKNGERWSTDKLLDLQTEEKLTIITHGHVDKVIIQSGIAKGIEYTKMGKKLKAVAKKGIILSAGAIGSPKLLMLSGIGPRKHLEDLKINVISDLPVGYGLMDHILTGVDLITLNTSLPVSLIDALNPLSAFNYFFSGEGVWTSSGIEAIGTFYTPMQNNKSVPDVQLMVLPTGISKDKGIVLRKIMGISNEVYEKYFAPLADIHSATIAPVLLHPKSVGEVKLRSSDPSDDPLINPRYLSNREDISTLVHGIQFVKKLVATNAMKTLGASIYKRKFPGCEEKIFDSTEYWECYIKHLTLTSYHPAGTCRMGRVVDDSFRVYNVKNLYVVDASVFPSLPSGNINAAVIMLAEKAARMFKVKETTCLYQCQNVNHLCRVFNVCDNRITK